ncbi:hypothetical protein BDV30DRAFT_234084 [Aspergillus minisclerotigenes]|uniref:Uncharacterized protein n=1 Tax=Aspergillus minisclerotigenes TaxID=656917 RepID=A0A5N6JGZ9_9EURO|nr:hypothetical protein BDV30DRAFT_234084 [Aspergillus minisclerotigenes]
MASQKKAFFLTPTWEYNPTGPVQLGNIILSPTNPAEALNGPHRVAPIPESLFPVTTKTGVTCTGVSHQSSVGETYAFDMIETMEFIPTPEYLAQNMAAPAVVKFLERSRFRKYLHMITGLKVVRGAKIKSAASRASGVDFKVRVDMSGTGVPVNLGPEIATERKYRVRGSFESISDFVFAFRLRRIVVHRSGEITHAEYTKGASMMPMDPAIRTHVCHLK